MLSKTIEDYGSHFTMGTAETENSGGLSEVLLETQCLECGKRPENPDSQTSLEPQMTSL